MRGRLALRLQFFVLLALVVLYMVDHERLIGEVGFWEWLVLVVFVGATGLRVPGVQAQESRAVRGSRHPKGRLVPIGIVPNYPSEKEWVMLRTSPFPGEVRRYNIPSCKEIWALRYVTRADYEKIKEKK